MKENSKSGKSTRLLFLRVMKIYSILFLMTIVKLFGAERVFAQAVTLNVKNLELKTILSEIEKKTDYNFFYNNSLVDVSKKATVNADNVDITLLLEQIFSDKNVDFKIFKNQIVLFPKDDSSVLAIMDEFETRQNDDEDSESETSSNFTQLVSEIIQDPITGTVLDQNGLPLPGATVLIKGTTRGVQTDFDGNFAIQAESSETLVFSYIGYATKEIQVGSKSTINVTLEEDAQALEEVIVVAYGTSKKSDFTGSAVQISAEKIKDRPISNVVQALQGAAPGVNVSAASGQPGSTPNIQIRGNGSFSSSSEPLYVVDGVQFGGDLSSLNSNDIESLTVLKDAASTSLYGSRAANGVVLITTKKGRQGKSTANLTISQGITSRAIPEYERVNAEQYYPLLWEARRNALSISGTTPVADANQQASDEIFSILGVNPFNVPNNQIVLPNGQLNPAASLLYPDDLDWQEPLVRAGNRKNIDFSYSGGTEKSDFFASIGYLDDEGFIINSGFERITGRVNVNSQVTNWLKTGVNISASTAVSNNASDGTSNSFVNPFFTTRFIAPIYPVFEHDPVTGEFILDENGERIYDFRDDSRIGNTSGRHVVLETILNTDIRQTDNVSGRTFAEVKFLKDFTFTFNATLDKRFFYRERFQTPVVGDGNPAGRSLKTSSIQTTVNYNQLLNYNRDFGKHSIGALLGHENYDFKLELLTGTRQEIIADGNTELINFTTTTDLESFRRNLTREGYFSRLNYDFDDRYYVSASYRRDASSRFAENVRWGDFFSVGASWRIDTENFMNSVTWVNSLKLRASYGETGNDEIEFDNGVANFFPSQALFALGNNNAAEGGILASAAGNPDIKWETNIQKDVALEFGLFDNRVSGTIEYYERESTDLLFNVPLPTSAGLDEVPSNIGAWVNSGIEIDLNLAFIRTEDFSWNSNVNASTLKNEILRLPQEELINGSKKLVVGGDQYDFWLRDWFGVDPADGSALYILDPELGAVGDSDVRQINGTTVTTNQNKANFDFVGNATPDLFGAFTNTFNYKNFELGFTFTYQLGGETYDTTWGNLMDSGSAGDALSVDILRRWQQPGDITDVPRLDSNQINQFGAGSDRFLIDSDFLSLRQANIAYSFDRRIIEGIGLSGLRVFASGENLVLFNKRTGLDVVQNFQGTTSNRFTPSRVITLGLNVTF
ncbi:TonB-dependent receptor [Maribacter sp. 2210JD10-5]|uniref:TonB-dependent receptor n=1 Tax=Maribacter sp. 2210JD10-5 TaxID=3386272 RepID=UPI0039BD924D